MPTVAEIERLEALIGRLVPLSNKQRGELIAADDWNMLVGALIEVGRAALTAESAETVPAHEHSDQVGIGWLDPRVRQLVTGGGLKDPAVDVEFIKLRRDLTSLSTRVDRAGTDIDQARLRIDEVFTNDLAREALLTRLNRKVLGADDDRGDIADMRTTLRTLQTEVGRAVEVGTRLQSNGQPIDVPALVERVAAVEQLRDRLTQPDGELLDAATLEVRLLELQTSFVRQGDLTDAIADVRIDLGGRGGFDRATFLDEARLAGREAAVASVETLGIGLRSEIASRFGDISPAISAAVAQATSSLRADVLTAARADLDAAVSGLDSAVRADFTGLIEERFGAAAALIDERLAVLPDLVGSQVAQQIDVRLPASLADVAGRIDGIQADVFRIGDQTTANTAAISDADLRFATARREEASERAQLRVQLLDRIAGVEARIEPRITTAIDDARAILRTDLEATVAASRRDLESRLMQVARDAAETEVRVLSTSIRTDVQSVVRQEIDANLAAVRAEISAEVTGLTQRVAGLVSNEVTRATAGIPGLVSAEIETFRPEIIRLVDNRLGRPPIV